MKKVYLYYSNKTVTFGCGDRVSYDSNPIVYQSLHKLYEDHPNARLDKDFIPGEVYQIVEFKGDGNILSEERKKEIFELAKKNGFYGDPYGDTLHPEIGFRKPENIKSLEFDTYKKEYDPEQSIAAICIPNFHSGEGYHAYWHFDDYGKTWALTEGELK